MQWQKVQLDNVCVKITDGAHASPPSQDEGFPMASVKDMTPQGLNLESSRKISSQHYQSLVRSGCKPEIGDVLIAKDGNSCLQTVCLQKQEQEVVLLSSVAILRPNQKVINPQFLTLFLSFERTKKELQNYVSGAAIPRVVLKDFKKYSFLLPPIETQKRIAEILSAYDDLIENNLKRIRLLEESARLLYREWFVRLKFPNHEHTPLIDGLPEDWERKPLGEVCKAIGGGTPSTQVSIYWEDGEVIWVTPTDITRNNCLVLLDSEKKISEEGLKNSSARLVPPETILMTSRASVGFFGIIDKEVCTNQGFISIIPNRENYRMYMLHNLMSRKEEILLNAGGTTYKEITKTTFNKLEIVLPSENLLNEFQSFAYDTIKQTRLLQKQNQKLKQARDLLLPRLMSGEIAV